VLEPLTTGVTAAVPLAVPVARAEHWQGPGPASSESASHGGPLAPLEGIDSDSELGFTVFKLPCSGLRVLRLWDGGNSRPTRMYYSSFASCGFQVELELCLNLQVEP
jgi:hypothetical protein